MCDKKVKAHEGARPVESGKAARRPAGGTLLRPRLKLKVLHRHVDRGQLSDTL